MATTYTATAAGANVPTHGHGIVGNLKVVTEVHEISAAIVINDVFQMVSVPAGAVVVDVMLVTDDIDTNVTPLATMDVGYGGDVNYFIAASTIGRTGGVARADASTAFPLKFSSRDTIDIHFAAAPATSATSGTFSLSVFYFIDPNFVAT